MAIEHPKPKPLPIQNEVPEYGQARYKEPRQRQFGVLGFDDRPEALIGGTVIHKGENFEDSKDE